MAFDLNDPADVELLNKKIAEETEGLKKKNSELLGDQKKIKDKLTDLEKRYEGIDPDKIKVLLGKFDNDEEAKLIADGKINEVFEKRTDRLRKDYENKLAAKEGEILTLQTFSKKSKQSILSAAVKDAAAKAGVIPEALDDVLLRANMGFKVDDEGNITGCNGDEVVFGKDGKTPLQPVEWVETLREKAPHFWPKASGGGAGGSGGGKVTKKWSEMSEKEHVELQAANPAEYARIRDAEKGKTGKK